MPRDSKKDSREMAKATMPKPYSKDWEEMANALARGYTPMIYVCSGCGGPVVHGYCCTFCGSSPP